MNIGQSLLRIRQQQKLTQNQVGLRAGLATSYLSRIENGHIEPTMKTLSKLASAFQMPVAHLFQLTEHQVVTNSHSCPVSNSGACIGEQIRSQHGRVPGGKKSSYRKEALRLLSMTDYISQHGSLEVRRTLAIVLESLMSHPK
jgi:transcriptional regulator with XRE-family HTH domain